MCTEEARQSGRPHDKKGYREAGPCRRLCCIQLGSRGRAGGLAGERAGERVGERASGRAGEQAGGRTGGRAGKRVSERAGGRTTQLSAGDQ